jgi:hypothetical protein
MDEATDFAFGMHGDRGRREFNCDVANTHSWNGTVAAGPVADTVARPVCSVGHRIAGTDQQRVIVDAPDPGGRGPSTARDPEDGENSTPAEEIDDEAVARATTLSRRSTPSCRSGSGVPASSPRTVT